MCFDDVDEVAYAAAVEDALAAVVGPEPNLRRKKAYFIEGMIHRAIVAGCSAAGHENSAQQQTQRHQGCVQDLAGSLRLPFRRQCPFLC
jgi:hypothetical protein